MTIADRVLACLRDAAESDADFARRGKAHWEGWCDLRRVCRWLAAGRGPPAREETVRRALAQLVKAGSVEAHEDQWRVAPGSETAPTTDSG